MPDDPTDEVALAHESHDRSDGPARRDSPRVGQAVSGWISDHMIVASVSAFVAVCLIVAAGDATLGKRGIWFAVETLAVIVCASGAYFWNRASASADAAAIVGFRRQTLGGAFVIVLIAIRIATRAY